MRNTREVRTRVGQVMYHGKKYAIEPETGYLVCTSGSRTRLHVQMWLYENSAGVDAIPGGYVIHHIDGDKTHNEISNLTAVTVEAHNLIHNPPASASASAAVEVVIVPGGISFIKYNNST